MSPLLTPHSPAKEFELIFSVMPLLTALLYFAIPNILLCPPMFLLKFTTQLLTSLILLPGIALSSHVSLEIYHPTLDLPSLLPFSSNSYLSPFSFPPFSSTYSSFSSPPLS